jgi:Fe-Mn family superoxide dismutase
MNVLLTSIISLIMTYNMPILPYSKDALSPIISQETVDYHYGKHLQTYINNLNSLVSDTPFEGKTVEEIVSVAPDGAIFNNAGQVLNHTLFFEQLQPAHNAKQPSGEFLFLIEQSFGSFEKMIEQLDKAAASFFGSGWTFLAMDEAGELKILSLPNGDNPLRYNLTPLLAIDVWEHAYYLDYQNRRKDYLKNLWLLINWHVVSGRVV